MFQTLEHDCGSYSLIMWLLLLNHFLFFSSHAERPWKLMGRWTATPVPRVPPSAPVATVTSKRWPVWGAPLMRYQCEQGYCSHLQRQRPPCHAESFSAVNLVMSRYRPDRGTHHSLNRSYCLVWGCVFSCVGLFSQMPVCLYWMGLVVRWYCCRLCCMCMECPVFKICVVHHLGHESGPSNRSSMLLLSLSCGHDNLRYSKCHTQTNYEAEQKHYRWIRHTDILTTDFCEKRLKSFSSQTTPRSLGAQLQPVLFVSSAAHAEKWRTHRLD